MVWLVPVTAAGAPGPGALAGLEERALRRINEARRDAGLPAVAPDAALFTAAREHAADMARQGYVGHLAPRPDQRTVRQRLALAGVSDAEAGENVGRYGTNRAGTAWTVLLDEVCARLLASPEHRPRILDPSYTHAGTGVATGFAPADADTTVDVPAVYVTQLFIARRTEILRLEPRADGAAVRFDLAARLTVPGRPALRLRRGAGDPVAIPVAGGGRGFTAAFHLPADAGPVVLELDVLQGTRRLPARRWRLDPLQPPLLAIGPDPE